MSVNAWRGDHPLDGFESKSEHVTMSISAEQISTEPITRQVARLFLCGDVMTGRGIDQILPHPCDPLLHESYVKSARDYIRLAEQVNGRIPKLSSSRMFGVRLCRS
jgi:poly-gamma-glutamate synthesis protein (capsule biosynthesis protein)